MERAHVRAWPALETADIEGWLLRISGGASQRANSVSTVDFHGADVQAAIGAAEARYRLAGTAARFQTFDETAPVDLPERLRQCGYRETEATITLTKQPLAGPIPPEVQVNDDATDDWRAVYLGQITDNRRVINARILERIPRPSAFFTARLNGVPVATALCVVDAGCAVVECVATAMAARRRGAGRRVMLALESWAASQGADRLGLQVVRSNDPAVALYKGLGFEPTATNRFWMRDPPAGFSA
jgi:GNAT superfamily N-acetyltransferase